MVTHRPEAVPRSVGIGLGTRPAIPRGAIPRSRIAPRGPVVQWRDTPDGTTGRIVREAIVPEETEDPGPLDHRASPMRHPQDDVAAGLRQVGPCPLVVEGQSMELQEHPDRAQRERLGSCPPAGVPAGHPAMAPAARIRDRSARDDPRGDAFVPRSGTRFREFGFFIDGSHLVTEGKYSGSSRPRAVHSDVIPYPPVDAVRDSIAQSLPPQEYYRGCRLGCPSGPP